jgi:hypothetical protein
MKQQKDPRLLITFSSLHIEVLGPRELGKSQLAITPKETPEGHVLEVSGDLALLRTGDVLVESPIQRTSQQYIGVSTPLAGIILNPAPLLTARQPQ